MGFASAAFPDVILKCPSTVLSSDLAPERQKNADPEEIP